MRLRSKLEIGAACVVVPLLLELMPASRALAWIARAPRRGPGAEPLPPERVARHVDRLLARLPWIWHHTCLRRAAALAFLLRRVGRDAEVVIGVRRDGNGALEAHAWLRCDGVEPYLEPGGGDVMTFVPLVRPTR